MNIFINSQTNNNYNNNWNFIQVYNLGELANVRKTNLKDNADYLCFMWKADVVESWIADKEAHVRSDEFGRDLSSVQTLLTKQETFDIGLKAFETEGIQNITELKDKLISSNHIQVSIEILMLISCVFNIRYLFIYFLLFLFSLRKVKADVIITFCVQAQSINKKYSTVIERWNSLLADSANRENRLLQVIYLFIFLEHFFSLVSLVSGLSFV